MLLGSLKSRQEYIKKIFRQNFVKTFSSSGNIKIKILANTSRINDLKSFKVRFSLPSSVYSS